jgi:hypothetical protein
MRSVLTLALLLAAGCAETQVGVLGTGPGLGVLGVWRGEKFTAGLVANAHGDGVHSFGPDDARAFGLRGRWMLVGYRAGEPPPDSTGELVVRARQLDGRDGWPPRLDDLIAALERRQLDQLAELHVDLSAEPPRPLQPPGGGHQVVHAVKAIEWLGDRLRVVVRTDVVKLRWGQPCAGIEMPPRWLPDGGVALTRGYEIDRAGRITRTAVPPLAEYGAPYCDPRIP